MSADDWPLWQRLVRHADDASQVAYVEQGTGRRITYRALVDRVHAATAPAAVDVIHGVSPIAFVIRFLAAMRNGSAALPIDKSAAAERDRLVALAGSGNIAGPAVLLASSGTTGRPKLVRRERDSLDAVAAAMADAMTLTPADRVLAAVPLSHSYGLEHGLLAPLWAGCTTVVCDGLDLPAVSAAWHGGATVLPAVPSMLEGVLRGDLRPTPTLRRVYTAGAPLPATVAADFRSRHGLAVGQVYGMTEVGSVVVHDPARDACDTVGRPVAGVSLRTDDDGELLVRSPSMLSRYLGDTLRLVDGHFPTGDLAMIAADGQLKLVGRRRLLIDVGGAKVNPQEVEAVLLEHPAVAACAVVPLALSETVRRVKAVVVPANVSTTPTAIELRDFVRARLARHKVPRVIEFRDSLPRTSAGKVARQLLEMP